MGNQCSSSLKQQFQLIRQYEHPSLGYIKVIKCIKNSSYSNRNNQPITFQQKDMLGKGQQNTYQLIDGNDKGQQERMYEAIRTGQTIGIKQVYFGTSKDRDQYLKYVKQANTYYKIPTLLRILNYEIVKSGSNSIVSQGYRCGTTFSVNIYFPFYSFTLTQIIAQKRKYLSSLFNDSKCPLKSLFPHLKLNNYAVIDKLPFSERKILSSYYQLIDYIVGALYFLNHLQHKHQAVCPDNILVGNQGKYALIDPVAFELSTNYEVALSQTNKKIGSKGTNGAKDKGHQGHLVHDGIKYLSPELLSHLKNGDVNHKQNSQKAEVFSVGLIALQMCLIDYNFMDEDNSAENSILIPKMIDRKAMKLSQSSLTKALVEVQSRYSLELADLLSSMLEYDPKKRINFSTLIDMLSPLLMSNLGDIQKLYKKQSQENLDDYSGRRNLSSNTNINFQTGNNQVIQKLSQLQQSYQKVLNRTTLLEYYRDFRQSNKTRFIQNQSGQKQKQTIFQYRPYNQKQIIEEQKKILKQLKKINVLSKGSHSQINLMKEKRFSEKIINGQKREVKGSELYDIYLNQYETIKKNRLR